MNLAPIVLFVYNRPGCTRQTVESLKKNRYAEQSKLIIYADGPKEGESDLEIRVVREYIKNISGFKSISIIEHQQNLGLANSIINGVTEVVNKYGKVIVLEDDLETSPDFLRFMNESLGHYSEDDQVMQISGHMFNLPIEAETDAVFLPFTNSIGWATWKQSWDSFDPLMTGYQKLEASRSLRNRFNLDGAYDYFGLLGSQLKGEIDSWAIRWYLSVFIAGGMVLYPIVSLVKHIGFSAGATHCSSADAAGIYATYCAEIKGQHIHFPDVSINEDVYSRIKLLLSTERSLMVKLRTLFSKFLKKSGFAVNY